MTDEPSVVTLQSLSTSISFEVSGERGEAGRSERYEYAHEHELEQTTSMPSYELVPAGVEIIQTNSSNMRLFKASASAVPEKFDDLTISVLNHAKALVKNDSNSSNNDDDDDDELKKKV